MPASDHRLTTQEMAEFTLKGFLRFDAFVPEAINERVFEELGDLYATKVSQIARSFGIRTKKLKSGAATSPIGESNSQSTNRPDSLTPLSACYPPPSIIGEMLRLPQVHGIIESLVGGDPLFDHDFVHYIAAGSAEGQHLHVDAVIDNRHPSFDIQLFYFPTAVAPKAGGTRFVPGTHLRRTRAEGVARYQHLLGEEHYCGPAGTILIFHQGLWHAGQPNPSEQDRWMYKVRLNPQVPQVRLWNLDDFEAMHNDARDHTFARMRHDSVAEILRKMLPWQQGHELRYEQMERARLWRYLSDDPAFDVDFYHTRMEGRARVNQAFDQ